MRSDDDDDAWFLPKRYGIGAGLPISWQGWVLLLVFAVSLVMVIAAVRGPVAIVPVLLLVAVFSAIAVTKTRGGWKWRWGRDEDD